MKQKQLNNILYVFDVNPYIITQDTSAEVIKVQEESYDGFVEMNPSLAEKIVKYNYHLMCVKVPEWAPYAKEEDPQDQLTFGVYGADASTYIEQIQRQNASNVVLQHWDAPNITFPFQCNVNEGEHCVIEFKDDVNPNELDIIGGEYINIRWIDEETGHYWAATGAMHESISVGINSYEPGGTVLNISGENAEAILKLEVYDHEGTKYDEWYAEPEEEWQKQLTFPFSTEFVSGDYFKFCWYPAQPPYNQIITGIVFENQWYSDVTYSWWTQTSGLDETVNMTVNAALDPETSWSAPAATVTIGADDNVFPTLSNPHNVAVHYWSTDNLVAPIDFETGAITLNNAGTTMIGATCDEQGYGEYPATYTLTVQAAQPSTHTIVVTSDAAIPEIMEQTPDHQTVVEDYTSPSFPLTMTVNDGNILAFNFGNQASYADFDINPVGFFVGNWQDPDTGDNIAWTDPITNDFNVTIANPQPSTYTVTLDGTDIHQAVTVKMNNETVQTDYQYFNIADGTVVDVYPTGSVADYTLVSGAVWDTDHWTATVNGADLQITINYDSRADAELSWELNGQPAVAAYATLGDPSNVFPTIVNPHGVSVGYESTDQSVATIDATTGVITLVGEGHANIWATFGGDVTYKPQDVTYMLYVQAAQPSTYTVTLSGTDILQNATVKMDDVTVTTQSQYQNVADGTVVDVYPTGSVANYTLVSGATWSTDHWTATVNGADLTIIIDYDGRADAELSWSSNSASVDFAASDNVFPTLTNPNSVTVTYSSSDTTKATINATTGQITLKDVGNTVISAVYNGDSTYKPQTVTYTLTITSSFNLILSNDIGIFDESAHNWVSRTRVGNTWCCKTTSGVYYSIENRQGKEATAYGKTITFDPTSVATGTNGTVGPKFNGGQLTHIYFT